MSVFLCRPRNEPDLQALLWQGNAADLSSFGRPFPVNHSIDSKGTLHFVGADYREFDAIPYSTYILMGITGQFFAMSADDFTKTYVRI